MLFRHGRLVEPFGHAVVVGPVGDLFVDLGQVGLMVGILDMALEFCPFSREIHPTPEEIAGGAYLGRIDIGLWKHRG